MKKDYNKAFEQNDEFRIIGVVDIRNLVPEFGAC